MDFLKLIFDEKSPIMKSIAISATVTFILKYLENNFNGLLPLNYTNHAFYQEIVMGIILLFSVIIFILSYLWLRKLPLFIKERGILIYINTDCDEKSYKLKSKLEGKIRLIYNNSQLKSIKLVFLNDVQIRNRTISPKFMKLIIRKTRALLFYVIDISEGTISNKNYFDLECTYILKHKAISVESSAILSKDINRNILKLTKIDSENTLRQTRCYSESCVISLCYAIGLNRVVAGDIENARVLFNNAYKLAIKNQMLDADFKKNIKKIIIPINMSIIQQFENDYFVRKHLSIEEFKNQLAERYEMLDFLNTQFGLDRDRSNRYAATNFIFNRDTQVIRKLTDIDKKFKKLDAVSRINKAFVLIYEGEFLDAYKIYSRQLGNCNCSNLDLVYTKNYTEYILNDEPDKIQLYIPIILLNYYYFDDSICKKIIEELKTKANSFKNEELDLVIGKLDLLIN